jgi:hypothetical protein
LATRARATVEAALLLVVIGVVVVFAVGWERIAFLGGDHEMRVFSHHGRLILKPSLVLPSATPGQPPDFKSSFGALIVIPARMATEGREILVCGPGCGLLHGKFDGEHRVTLPPPIRVTIRVPGDFRLPSGDHGIDLRFSVTGVRPEVATAARAGPASSDHWDKPESPVWDECIWLDPTTRSASVLLPCTGTWRVIWSQVERRADGKAPSFSIALGHGDATLTIDADGEEHTLAIDPEALGTFGVGPGGK